MLSSMENWNGMVISPYGFVPYSGKHKYGTMGQCWKLMPDVGNGYFWVYGEKDLFDIKIHNFYFNEDTLIESDVSGYLSIFYYDSISGEQLKPYRRLNAGCIQSIAGNNEPYKMWVHKKIPIRCIGIGISPSYYEDYLKAHYPEEYLNPSSAFAQLNQDATFPELVFLLKQVKNYRGNGIAAKMFYEGKVTEVVALLLERMKSRLKKADNLTVSHADMRQMQTAIAYLNDHYSCNISLGQLSNISCMSTTKFKLLFKKLNGCTVTSYIQHRRLSHAECLLSETDLTIEQIAKSVGYSTSSRLAELFRQSIGLTPLKYRKMTTKR